jgi:two-component system, NtrC family, response regulator HydG
MRHRDTILVVDDDSDACEALGGLLEESGFSVEAADNGARALARLDQGIGPDLVLTDLQMPVMDGLELIRRIQARDHAPPVILVTGMETGDLCTGAGGYGAVECLVKPIDADELLWAIERALACHRAA